MTARFSRPTRFSAALFTALMLAPAFAHAEFDRAAWQRDFAQLQKTLQTAYANLDWAVAERRMDLRMLSTEARRRLEAAQSDEEARMIFDRFLQAFGDGHLYISWPRPAPAPAPAATAAKPAAPAAAAGRSCADLGYRKPRDEGVDFSTTTDFTPLKTAESALFPAGVLKTANGKRLGVLRIALLAETAFPTLCEQIHKADAPCDDQCEYALRDDVGERLTQALATQARALAATGVDGIAVDLTGNGGGSDWAEVAARVLTAPGMTAPEVGMIKHTHWSRNLGFFLGDIETDLKKPDLPTAAREALEEAKKKIEAARRDMEARCERDGVWDNQPSCSLVLRTGLRSTGFLSKKPTYAVSEFSADHVLYRPGRRPFEEGAYRGPLAILMDGNTASAAELFSATLKDNGRAVLVGALTQGSGCGYTSGGIKTQLVHSKGNLRLPDCLRYRANGVNEVTGLDPDVPVAWRVNFSRHQKSQRMRDGLERWAAQLK